ncbi:MAG: 2-C-methyl-D-erythritol 2,4-cyclodiphosphate synthase [Balneolales bacterium]
MEKLRVGFGYDVHRLVKNRKLILGGVEVPHHSGLKGHSDADVLIHAIIDALLGAAALGDIGKHFPDNMPEYKNIDSRNLLLKTKELLLKHQYNIVNIDATIVAQEPKLLEFIPEMIENIASDLDMPEGDISIKATTGEQIGSMGRREGINATAITLLRSIEA